MIDALNRQQLVNGLYRSMGDWHPRDTRLPKPELVEA